MLKDEIEKVLEELYLDNRGNAVRGDYKMFISQALTRILELVEKEKGEKK